MRAHVRGSHCAVGRSRSSLRPSASSYRKGVDGVSARERRGSVVIGDERVSACAGGVNEKVSARGGCA